MRLPRVVLLAFVALAATPLSARDDRPEIRHAHIDLDRTSFEESIDLMVNGEDGVEPSLFRSFISRPIEVPIRAPEPFLAATATWNDSQATSSPSFVSLRSSSDGLRWSDWEELRQDGDASTGHQSVGGLLLFPSETRWIQLRIALPHEPDRLAILDGVRAVFISPGKTSSLSARVLPSPPATTMDVSKPPVVTRTEWGCPDGQESPGWTPKKTTVTHLIVHHTVNSNSHDDWPAVVRSIFSLHTYTNGWGDIGYNFLIDPNGVIYEGRAGGHDIQGAHFTCANSNTMGMAFLGTFSNDLPTPEAREATIWLLAWKADEREIDPLGFTHHPSTDLQLPNIAGHRDGNATTAPRACPKGTECPGDALYATLPALRLDVAELIAAAAVEIEVDAPNGGEIWSIGNPHAITWKSEGLDPEGELTIRLSLDGGETSEEIARVDPSVTKIAWTPSTEHISATARIWVGSVVDDVIEASDLSDHDFAIAMRSRARSVRRP